MARRATTKTETPPPTPPPAEPISAKEALPGILGLQEIPVSSIRPSKHNPRTLFDEDGIDELASSIEEHGLLQPIVVTPIPVSDDEPQTFEIIAGERRWRAFTKLERPTIQAIIREVQDDGEHTALSIVENLHRQDLDPIETARAFRRLKEMSWSDDKIAGKINRSKSVVANTVRLLELPSDIQDLVRIGKLSPNHGVSLLALKGKDEESIGRIGHECATSEATVVTLRDMVKDALDVWKAKNAPPLPLNKVDEKPEETAKPEENSSTPVAPPSQNEPDQVDEKTEATEDSPIPPAAEPATSEAPPPAEDPQETAPPQATRPSGSDGIKRPASSGGTMAAAPPPTPPAEETPAPNGEFTNVMLKNALYDRCREARISPAKAVAAYFDQTALLPEKPKSRLEKLLEKLGPDAYDELVTRWLDMACTEAGVEIEEAAAPTEGGE